jgi:hypothetical protein
LRQKKHYAQWKKLIKNLGDKVNEKDKQNEKKGKTKTFEDVFTISTITRYCSNRLDYNPLQGA